MINRKLFIILFAVLFYFAFTSQSLAYEPATTHKDLTSKIVEVYNKYYSPKISIEQANWIIEGTIKEDTPPRWINHFYDPIYKVGWTGENEGDIPADTIKKLSKILLSPYDAVSSINWLHNVDLQGKYGFYEGDQTYERSLRAFGYASLPEGMKGVGLEDLTFQNSYIALGHTLHLLEDMGVPAHTRNDTHADVVGTNDGGEPYEKWAGQTGNDDMSFLNNLDPTKENFLCTKIDDCFINLAKYTNENFYSKDTIGDQKYKVLKSENVKENLTEDIYFRKDNSNNNYPFKIFDKKTNKSTVTDPLIHRAYWQLLSKQIVLAGVQTLNIFFNDTKTAVENAQYPQNVVSLKKIDLSFISPFSFLKTTNNIFGSLWNSTKNAFANVGSVISDLFGSAQDVISNSLNSGSNLKQIGEIDTSQQTTEQNNQTQDQNQPQPSTNTSTQTQATSADIAITEIMYNPKGSDSGREWIEIFNNDDAMADLTGWKFFENNTNHNLKLIKGSSILNPFEYAVIVDDAQKFLIDYPQYKGAIFESSFSINNNGETIAIKSGDLEIDSIKYQPNIGANGNGNSLQLLNNTWQEGEPTPGKPNKALSINNINENIDSQNQNDQNSESQINQDQTQKTDLNTITTTNAPICNSQASQSAQHSGIILNEITWMGSTQSASDEWIELKNISSREIDLSNWQIINKNQSIKINLSKLKNKSLKPGTFILLERTDNNSTKATADLIYSGALSNSNESLKLFNNNCDLIDEAIASPNWPAGDNEEKRTMERNQNDLGWHTSSVIGGTPKKENSAPYQLSYGSGGGTSQTNNQQSTTNNTPTPQFYNVVINEIMYDASGSDDGREWIELFNKSASTIDLTDWKLSEGGTNHGLTLKQGDKNLSPNAYVIISNDSTKFLTDFPGFSGAIFQSAFSLSNTGETITLKNQDLKIDETTYSTSTGANGNGKSAQSINGIWQEATPTPGQENKADIVLDNSQNTQLTAQFFYSPTSPKAGEEITFDASLSTSTGTLIDSYEWNFGDQTSATSSLTTIKHTFQNEGEFNINLKILAGSASSTTSTVVLVIPVPPEISTSTDKILISEIMAGAGSGHSDEEFIELYNPTDNQINLTNYSLKRKSSITSTSTQTLASTSVFNEKFISSKGFFLIASSEYQGSINPDIRYSSQSYHLAYDDDVIILLKDNQIVDQVDYASITESQSLERKAFENNLCVSAQGSGELLGNGCDIDNASDFELRVVPNPQNSQDLLEPREDSEEKILTQSDSSVRSSTNISRFYVQNLGMISGKFSHIEIYGETDTPGKWTAELCKISANLYIWYQCAFNPPIVSGESNETISSTSTKELITFDFPLTELPEGDNYVLVIKQPGDAGQMFTSALYGSPKDGTANGNVISHNRDPQNYFWSYDVYNIGIQDIYYILK